MRIEKVKTTHLNGRFCFLTGNDHIARPQTATKQMPRMMMMALSVGSWNLEPENFTFWVQTEPELWVLPPPPLLLLLLPPPPLPPPPLGAIALGCLFLQISKLSLEKGLDGREKGRRETGTRSMWGMGVEFGGFGGTCARPPVCCTNRIFKLRG